MKNYIIYKPQDTNIPCADIKLSPFLDTYARCELIIYLMNRLFYAGNV